MKGFKSILFFLALSFMLITGMKCEKEKLTKEDMPAITQTGADTFGFLLNGEVYLPTRNFFRETFRLSYYPDDNGGTLAIRADRLHGDNDKTFLSLIGINIDGVGKYELSSEKKSIYFYNNNKQGCEYHYAETNITGHLNITKLDRVNKIVSGTFEFKLDKDGCPAVNATQGRFDMRMK